MNRIVRVGSVPYLNSKPLTEGYRSLEGIAEFVFEPPSRLSAALARGELDVVLGSSIDYLRGNLEILPEVGIISRSAVNSVLLTGEVPIEEARTVNLDPSSLTSCALVCLWYKERVGRIPQFSRFPLGSPQASGCDAQLAIGDEALRRSGSFAYQVDMGAAWREWMGHPFVYAVWLVRRGVDLGEVGPFLRSRPARVEAGLVSMAERASEELGLDRSVCVEYLTSSLHFRLDPDSIEGLRRFLDLGALHHGWLQDTIAGFPDLGVAFPVAVEFYDLSRRRLSTGS